MPPRLAVSSHAVVPFNTEVRSIVGPPTMPPICISSTRFIRAGRSMVIVEVPSMSRPPIDRRNGPSAVRPLSAGDLVFTTKRLARGGDDPGDAILLAAPGEPGEIRDTPSI